MVIGEIVVFCVLTYRAIATKLGVFLGVHLKHFIFKVIKINDLFGWFDRGLGTIKIKDLRRPLAIVAFLFSSQCPHLIHTDLFR